MSCFTCHTKSPADMADHATGGTTASTASDWHSCAARWLLGHRRKIEQPGKARCSRSLAEASSCSSAAGSTYNEVANTWTGYQTNVA